MSQQAKKSHIALFVIGALAVGGLMFAAFGGGHAFSRHRKFLLYFTHSINGLQAGSNVKFKGVPVGVVDSVHVRFLQAASDNSVPVFVNVDIERLQKQMGLGADLSDPTQLKDAIAHGLRGKLAIESYVTGLTYVDLDYYPNAPPPPKLAFDTGVGVIPTLPSDTSDLHRTVTFESVHNVSLSFETCPAQKIGRYCDVVHAEKLQELIIHLGNHPQVGNLGPTKLWKLVYFIDAKALRDFGSPITGSEFIKFEHGPVPSRGEKFLRQLARQGFVSITPRDVRGKTLNEITAQRPANPQVFSSEELAAIEAVCAELGRKSAVALSALSHREPAWHYAQMQEKLAPALMAYGPEEDPDAL